MPTTMPRRVITKSKLVLAVTVPLAASVMAGAAFDLFPTEAMATVVMVYVALVGSAATAAVSMILSKCHLAIAQAFAAGLMAGRAMDGQPPRQPQPGPRLRVVE